MKKLRYQEIEARSQAFYAWLGAVAVVLLIGLGSGYYMETQGHHVTGMNNQIVWGMPHVFAIFLIVAASGALNAASVSSVFGKPIYKPIARLSALLSIGLLAGGLMVLVLDLGRPFIPVFKILVELENLNPTSIFAWNVFLYPVFMGITAIYLWFMIEPKMNRYSTVAGWAAFISRLVLTTGTGLIFGVLVARTPYDFALLAPKFIIMSFSYGTAAFIITVLAVCRFSNISLGAEVMRRLKNLLAVFVAAVLYMTTVYFITKLYYAGTSDFARFILFDGGFYTNVFWFGQILIGSVIPLVILLHPGWSKSFSAMGTAAALTIVGGIFQVYLIVVASQVYPLQLFPGKIVNSPFNDGVIHQYTAQLPEYLLGISGVALAVIIVNLGVKLLRIMPASLADADIDPHYRPPAKEQPAGEEQAQANA